MLRALSITLLLGACAAPVTTRLQQEARVTEVGLLAETRTLDLRTGDVTVDAAKKRVVFVADSRRQRASYSHYLFNADEFAQKVGAARDVRLRVIVAKRELRTYQPGPDMPSPSGGFRITENFCKIVSVEKVVGEK